MVHAYFKRCTVSMTGVINVYMKYILFGYAESMKEMKGIKIIVRQPTYKCFQALVDGYATEIYPYAYPTPEEIIRAYR